MNHTALGDGDGDALTRAHPRVLTWPGLTALALGGSNQSLFLIGALVALQGTAAVPLLVVGLLLSWAAAPGWTELILMWPDRVGGIAATCAEAFRPYSPVLANLTGVCYWWGWVPTCGLTALLSASALHSWYLPGVPTTLLASALVVAFTIVNLSGIRHVTRLVLPIAACSASFALLSAVIPVIAGRVDWARATSFTLATPFHGTFGALTSTMAGLYLIGFAAPAFEAAACHVGETKDPVRNVPRAMFASGAMAGMYFLVLPVVWLGAIGKSGLGGPLMHTLGPTFAPLLAGGAKAAAVWFMVTNMFHGTVQPLAGAARTLSQLSEDGLLPRMLARRNHADAPWVATLLTAGMSLVFLTSGDPTWVLAAANLAYLIGIGLPSVAVWLLRRNAPEMERPWRAPRGTITLGLGAACVWGVSAILGFEQFGLPTVLVGIGLSYAGSLLYAWRVWRDRVATGEPRLARPLTFKLTGAMLLVMIVSASGYLIAVHHVASSDAALRTLLDDIFVTVAVLSLALGLVLPGMIATATRQLSAAATNLARGTVRDLTRAMEALSHGELEAAYAAVDSDPVAITTRDEIGLMAQSFNQIHGEVGRAARALDGAREELRASANRLERNVAQQAAIAELGQRALETLDVRELMATAVSSLRRVLELEAAVILSHDDSAGVFRVRAQTGLSKRLPGGGRWEPVVPAAREVPDSAALLGVLTARAPVSFGPPAPLPPSWQSGGPCSGLLTAIHEADRPWGLLCLLGGADRMFARDEVDFVHAMANVLSETLQRIRSLEEIRHQALHDPLTGLPNRTLCVDRLSLAVAASLRRGTIVGVLFLDLDHFKLINDSLGHSAGDDVLRCVAQRLDRTLRAGDTVARFGGDEFVMICADLSGPDHLSAIAARLADQLRVPIQIGEIEHRITASIGIATASRARCSAEDLIREADAAMYQAKERGRNRHEAFDEQMRLRAINRLRLANDLALALECSELRVEYQPIVRVADGYVCGAEALVRWRHPRRGEVSPGEFIPVAEESGAILAIGDFVLREACRAGARWRAAGCDVYVSVNVSQRQIRSGTLTQLVAAVLTETGLDAEALHLEITESVLMEETEMSIRVLDELKALGVSLVLDDFGTGYSSLAYVRRFPIDTIKIDRSFVADLAAGERGSAIVEAIVNMARSLRLSVIAEGVETASQAEHLSALHCGFAQGWLYAAAMPAGKVAALLGQPLAANAA